MSNTKPTNPKDIMAVGKLPTHLVPSSLLVHAAMAFAEGASKYGAFNWRLAGIRLSVYKSAHDRHMEKFWNGERCDPVTLVPHLASAIACLGIMVDAELCGVLIDDRPPAADLPALITAAEAVIEHVRKLNEGMTPHHNTIADKPSSRKQK